VGELVVAEVAEGPLDFRQALLLAFFLFLYLKIKQFQKYMPVWKNYEIGGLSPTQGATGTYI